MTNWKLPEESFYDQYTWPEIRDLPKEDRVAVIPIGAVEEHGHHLPINTDNFLLESLCSEATQEHQVISSSCHSSLMAPAKRQLTIPVRSPFHPIFLPTMCTILSKAWHAMGSQEYSS